ncbi:MAG: hypothetical protein R3D67_21140 [Hyphomicrobiaceae bacterium]
MMGDLFIQPATAAIAAAAERLGLEPAPLQRLFAIFHVVHTVSGGHAAAAEFALGVVERLERLVAGLDPDTDTDAPTDLLAGLALIDLLAPGEEGMAAARIFASGYLKVLIARDADVAEVFAEDAIEAFRADGRMPMPSPFLLVSPLLKEDVA